MSINEYAMNMSNECWLKCMMFPLCMMIKMYLCMINIPVCMFLVQILFKHSVYEFYLSLYMFMGG